MRFYSELFHIIIFVTLSKKFIQESLYDEKLLIFYCVSNKKRLYVTRIIHLFDWIMISPFIDDVRVRYWVRFGTGGSTPIVNEIHLRISQYLAFLHNFILEYVQKFFKELLQGFSRSSFKNIPAITICRIREILVV